MKSQLGVLSRTIEAVRERIGSEEPAEPLPTPDVGKRPYPDSMTDDDILKEHAYKSKNGSRLKKLLEDGDTSDYPSASEAELACASDLAFWFWLDPEAIERVMRASALARRKWDINKTYLKERTIAKALAGKSEYYGKELKASIKKKAKPVENEDGEFDYTKHMRRVQDLINNPPPPIEYLLPGLLAKGASSLLVGKPKSFKSTLAAQVAIALSGNEWMLNHWIEFGDVSQTFRVAIIDYEQSEPIAAQLIGRFAVSSVNDLLRIDKFPTLDAAGVEVLRKLIVEQRLDMVIIDSLTRAAPAPSRGVGVFGHEAEYTQRITNLAHDSGCHINLIAHAGKRDAADDPMQMIAGTNALAASVDDVMVLFKDGDDVGELVRRKLFVTGRNIPRHGTYVLEKESHEACFILRGSEEIFINGETRKMIVRALSCGAAMSATEIADALKRDKGQVHRALQGLMHEKLVVQLATRKYMSRTAAAEQEVRNLKDKKG